MKVPQSLKVVEPEPKSKEPAVVLSHDGSSKVSVFNNGVLQPQLLAAPAMRRTRGMGKAALKPIRATLSYYPAPVVGAAGAAISSTINMQPALCFDWAQFAALYDEVRMISAESDFRLDLSAGGPCQAAVCYDPIDGTALASISNTITFAQNMGPFAIVVPAATGTAPVAVNRTGFWKFRYHMLKGTAKNILGPAVVSGSDWTCTTDPADIYGFHKTYVNAPGGVAVLTLTQIFRMHCEFRSRQ